jgi:hypothetical protein
MAADEITLSAPNGKKVVLPRKDLTKHSVFFRELFELRPDDVTIRVENNEIVAFMYYKRWAALEPKLRTTDLINLSALADKYDVESLTKHVLQEVRRMVNNAENADPLFILWKLDRIRLDEPSRSRFINLLAEGIPFLPPSMRTPSEKELVLAYVALEMKRKRMLVREVLSTSQMSCDDIADAYRRHVARATKQNYPPLFPQEFNGYAVRMNPFAE